MSDIAKTPAVLIYDMWYNDWHETYEVAEFTDATFYESQHWFSKKIGKFGDFDQDGINIDRAIQFGDGTTMIEGQNYRLENGLVFTLTTLSDLNYLEIFLNHST